MFYEMSGYPSISRRNAMLAMNRTELQPRFSMNMKAMSANDDNLDYFHSPFLNDVKLNASSDYVYERG